MRDDAEAGGDAAGDVGGEEFVAAVFFGEHPLEGGDFGRATGADNGIYLVGAEAGGADARIAILPTASAIPAERALFYQDVFRKIGAGEAFPLPIVTRDDAHLPANLESIERATGVFMTGGDQSRLVAILAGSPALTAIQQNLVGGGALAGTSAGAPLDVDAEVTAALQLARPGIVVDDSSGADPCLAGPAPDPVAYDANKLLVRSSLNDTDTRQAVLAALAEARGPERAV